MGLDLTGGRRGPAALAEAMTRWISHLLGIDVAIEPLTELRDAKLTWYVGLDSEATKIGDRLWHGEALDDRTAGRVLALFRLSFADAGSGGRYGRARAGVSDPGNDIRTRIVRMKPQNLLTGLPIKHLEAATLSPAAMPIAAHSRRRRGRAPQGGFARGSISSGAASASCPMSRR